MNTDGDPAEQHPMPDDDGHEDVAREGTDVSARRTEAMVEGAPALVTIHPSAENREKLRIVEALLFAASEPLDTKTIAEHLPDETDCGKLLGELQSNYASRGVNLECIGGRWVFRTAQDLSYLLEKHTVEERRLSRAALETLSIIAYHQPVTRAEIEEIRGVGTSKGTLDVLMEAGWVRLRGRRRSPGRPVTYGTNAAFLEHFGLENLTNLPGLSELKGAGLLSSNLPPDFVVPIPTDLPDLTEDEDPLDDEDGDEPDLFEDIETAEAALTDTLAKPSDADELDKPASDG